ncbi:MAG: hypothetical protein ACRDWB_14060, partial [Acidimicrobiales bacterium]
IYFIEVPAGCSTSRLSAGMLTQQDAAELDHLRLWLIASMLIDPPMLPTRCQSFADSSDAASRRQLHPEFHWRWPDAPLVQPVGAAKDRKWIGK